MVKNIFSSNWMNLVLAFGWLGMMLLYYREYGWCFGAALAMSFAILRTYIWGSNNIRGNYEKN